MAQEKTAIILMGGGMRSAHGAGFLYALATEFSITSPDIMLGSSGDAGNTLYYVAGQYESAKHIWFDLLSTRRFISPLRFWKIMDVDYLIDTVFKKLDPLNTEKLTTSPIRWLISVTNYKTGKPRYLRKEDGIDPFEILRASKAIPVFYGRRVMLDGEEYFDGEIGPTLADHIKRVQEEGATRILIINHTSDHALLQKLIMEAYSESVGKELRQAILKDVSSTLTCIQVPGAQVLCVVPRGLLTKNATRNRKKVRATFDRGVEDARAMKDELNALFN